MSVRSYSTGSSMKPVKKYTNADRDKLQILKDNKGKAGVYCWRNLINGKIYVGSSVDLGKRFSEYYSIKYLQAVLKKGNSLISRALLKYGYSNFSLEIYEYCEPAVTIPREQFFLDKLNPEYNIRKIANSFFGCIHTDEAKAKISLALKGANHPFYNKNHSEETKAKISLTMKGNENAKGRPRSEGAGRPSVAIEVFDI